MHLVKYPEKELHKYFSQPLFFTFFSRCTIYALISACILVGCSEDHTKSDLTSIFTENMGKDTSVCVAGSLQEEYEENTLKKILAGEESLPERELSKILFECARKTRKDDNPFRERIVSGMMNKNRIPRAQAECLADVMIQQFTWEEFMQISGESTETPTENKQLFTRIAKKCLTQDIS